MAVVFVELWRLRVNRYMDTPFWRRRFGLTRRLARVRRRHSIGSA
jgi:hypothetical protein